ncbi:MAG TPA: hypothetical protein VFV75_03515 [Candidatus Polarisedimenticolaceae bacterium]|nr:hypothetical protein [Candidatus Polarisedimenticolaceae bacterium]
MLFLCLLAVATGSAANAPSPAFQQFEARLKDYVALHRKLEADLPRLPDRASPEEIDRNQRLLGKRIAASRADSKPGEFFTPPIVELIRSSLKDVLEDMGEKNLRASIMDENPGPMTLTINKRYPDQVPLSTMPPPVLAALPPLQEDLEYRFIGRRLVLLDVHAHLIVDYTDEVLP